MRIKAKDVGLILSLAFIIVIGAYWLLQDLKNENFDQYLTHLGEKLLAMIPESSEKRTIENMFTNFKQNVAEKNVTPEQVEQVAAEIMNIANISDTITIAEAKDILKSTGVVSDSILSTPKPVRIKKPIDEKKWQEMEDRIKNVYLFNETLKDRSRQLAAAPFLLYHVGDKLQVIIDSKIKSNSLLESDTKLLKELKQLEEEKLLLWQDDFEKEMQEKMKEIEEKMKIVNKKNLELNLARIKILENIITIEAIEGLDSVLIEADIDLDSLEIPSLDIKITP